MGLNAALLSAPGMPTGQRIRLVDRVSMSCHSTSSRYPASGDGRQRNSAGALLSVCEGRNAGADHPRAVRRGVRAPAPRSLPERIPGREADRTGYLVVLRQSGSLYESGAQASGGFPYTPTNAFKRIKPITKGATTRRSQSQAAPTAARSRSAAASALCRPQRQPTNSATRRPASASK